MTKRYGVLIRTGDPESTIINRIRELGYSAHSIEYEEKHIKELD